MSFNLGDVVPLSVSITDSAGQAANAGAVTVTVTLPDGTSETPAVTNDAVGVYNTDYPTTQAGVHQVRWVATGENASAFIDVFTVDPASDADFISLAELKRHLKKDPAKTDDDAELLEFISSACSMIKDRIGPVSPAPFTQVEWCKHSYRRRTIVLEQRPVIEVSSVMVDGTVVPEADADAGVDGWILSSGPGLLDHSRHWPWGRVEITYQAGRTPLPGNIRLAALELASHLWRSMKLTNAGNGRPNPAAPDDLALRGVSYALPYRVRELLGLGKLPNDDLLVG